MTRAARRRLGDERGSVLITGLLLTLAVNMAVMAAALYVVLGVMRWFAPENMLKSSGRGIFFMKSFMDDVRIARRSEGGMSVRMVKKLA